MLYIRATAHVSAELTPEMIVVDEEWLTKVRRDALEEAARVCDALGGTWSDGNAADKCATLIRSLATKVRP